MKDTFPTTVQILQVVYRRKPHNQRLTGLCQPLPGNRLLHFLENRDHAFCAKIALPVQLNRFHHSPQERRRYHDNKPTGPEL